MKVAKKQIRIVLYFVASGIFCTAIMAVLTYLFAVKHYMVFVDARITSSLNTDLVRYIQSFPCGLCVSPDLQIKKTVKLYPWVAGLSFQRIPTNAMHVSVAIQEPLIKVNNVIITKALQVLSASLFTPASLTDIPTLEIFFAASAEIPQSFVPCAYIFTSELFAPYAITWVDEYKARLTDKIQPHFSIIFNAYVIPNAATVSRCALIKQQLEERGAFTGKNKETHWIADTRFDRQIVVFSEKGGITHG